MQSLYCILVNGRYVHAFRDVARRRHVATTPYLVRLLLLLFISGICVFNIIIYKFYIYNYRDLFNEITKSLIVVV